MLRKRGVGEANVRVTVLTRERGLVVASARSARHSGSKLRYGLEPLTHARFCFVRGAHEWRVAEVAGVQHLPATPTAGRVAALLLRLIHGEEPNSALFDDVRQGFGLLASAEVETVLVLRILSHLGYLPRTEALAPYVDSEFEIGLSAKALAERGMLVRAINESLKATGL